MHCTEKKGSGKTTLAVSFALQESLLNHKAPIYNNVGLTIPGVETVTIRKANELIQMCTDEPCSCAPRIYLVDEFDKSFTSRIGWVEKNREQKLTELVSNIRKHNVIAFIATSQLKKKIKNDYRHNCDYVIEPTGTLDEGGFMEYFIWTDVELYESAGKKRYDYAEFCSSVFPLSFIENAFNTRQIIVLEWE